MNLWIIIQSQSGLNPDTLHQIVWALFVTWRPHMLTKPRKNLCGLFWIWLGFTWSGGRGVSMAGDSPSYCQPSPRLLMKWFVMMLTHFWAPESRACKMSSLVRQNSPWQHRGRDRPAYFKQSTAWAMKVGKLIKETICFIPVKQEYLYKKFYSRQAGISGFKISRQII